ncbi:MAG: hypothetical protein R3B98_05540 [Hyphomonas sp.]
MICTDHGARLHGLYGFLGIGKLAAQFLPLDLAHLFHLQAFLPDVAADPAGGAYAAAMASLNEKAWRTDRLPDGRLHDQGRDVFGVHRSDAVHRDDDASIGIAIVAMAHITLGGAARRHSRWLDQSFLRDEA